MKLAAALLLAQIHWTLPPQYRPAGYTRELRDGALVLRGPGPSGAMTETFAAEPWRGQTVRLRATLRVEGGAAARLLLRVDRGEGALGFFDNMGDRAARPAEWSTYTIDGEVAADAVTVEAGVESTGKGAVWVKDISFERVEAGADAPEIRAAYARVDAAFAAGNMAAVAATALPDAEIVLPAARLRLAEVLASQKGRKTRSRSTVTHLQVAGDQATVWVNNETIADDQGVLSSNRDEWTRSGGVWKLKRSTLIATRAVTPPEVLAQIRAHAGMPALEGVRILLWQGAAPAVEGFAAVPVEEVDPRFADAAGARAVAWLKENAPEEAGRAALAFQGPDPARVAAVVRVFERHRAATAEWARARHAALLVYQSKTARTEEAIAANVIWWASEGMPVGKIVVAAPNVAEVAGLVRKRYGRQVYTVRAIPRQLLGGALFLDLAHVPAGSALARWVAAQKFGVDGVVGE